jgi:Right handed beta helix region
MSGYYKGGFGKLRTNVAGEIRLRASLAPPPIVEGPPVVGGFYVSPTGSDLANGAIETPFGTLGRAVTATRAGSEKRIFMRDGVHKLTSTISLTSTDKGMSISPYQNEKPVISGGEKLTGFVDEGDGLFSKVLAQPSGLDLFVGGSRVLVGQGGYYDPLNPTRSGWLKSQGSAQSLFTVDYVYFKQDDIPAGILTPNLMIQVFDAARKYDHITFVSNIDYATKRITLALPHPSGPILEGAAYRLLNHPSFIERDGEFAWRMADSRIVFRPSSTDFETQGVYIPLLNGLIDLQNGADDITFVRLAFAHSQYNGFAISVTNSHRFRVGGCTFSNVGDGVRVLGGTDGKVGGCKFIDLANSGVVLDAGALGWQIYANDFSNLGRISKGAGALFSPGGQNTTFAFNDVIATPRYGATFKIGGSNDVIYNTFTDTGRETADSAAIEYVGNTSTDLSSLVEGNWIDRIPGYPDQTGGEFSTEFNEVEFGIQTENPRAKSWAVYLNYLASGVTVRGNFTRGASSGHFMIDGGNKNSIENNISILDEYDDAYAVMRNPQAVVVSSPTFDSSSLTFDSTSTTFDGT